MSKSELKPCPFCGGKAELYESEAYNLKTETKEKNIRWFVMCEQCTALNCTEKAIDVEDFYFRSGNANAVGYICGRFGIDITKLIKQRNRGTNDE